MRVVVIGAIRFPHHCVSILLDMGADLAGVVTLPPNKARHNADYCDLSTLAGDAGVRLVQVRRVSDAASLKAIRALRPDLILVLGFSQLLPRELLELPPMGCIGSHPAMLPRNRGRHPLIWALVEGLEESGLTFFYLDEGADSGDIVWQKAFPINTEDDAASLYSKIEILAGDGLREFIPQVAMGTAQRIPQDHSKASYWRKRSEVDGEIQWDLPGIVTYNLIRALSRPYIGAHTWFGSQRVTVWRALEPQQSVATEPPGTILSVADETIRVQTGDGELTIIEADGWKGHREDMCSGSHLSSKLNQVPAAASDPTRDATP